MNSLNTIDELVQQFYCGAEEYGVSADEAVVLLAFRGLRDAFYYVEDNPDLFEEGHEPDPWHLFMCELAETKQEVIDNLKEYLDEAAKEAADATQRLFDRVKKGGAA